MNAATFSDGEVGRAFLLDGVSAHVRVADSPSLHISGPMTVEAWIRPTAIGGDQAIMGKWGANPGPASTQLSFSFSLESDGRLYLLVCGDGGGADTAQAESTSSVAAGQWSHVAGVYDGSTVSVYINGVLSGQTSYGDGIFPGSNDLAIGGVVGGAASGDVIAPFNGMIDEAAIYRRALSGTEIAQIVAAGSAGRCKSPIAPTIINQPGSQTVSVGLGASFTVSATGRPLNYQWQFNHADIPGATNNVLNLSNVQVGQAGTYSVIVSNVAGIATSADAVLTVDSSCISAAPGLVAWWPAEGDASERINQNNGTLQAGLGFAAGEAGQGFSFDGAANYMSVPASPTVDIGSGQGFTIECWIKPTDVSSAHCIAEWNNGAGGIGLQFWHSDPGIGGLGAVFANVTDISGAGHVFATSPGLLTSNVFQHIALTYSKSNGVAALYRNGALAASSTIGQVRAQTTFPLFFGRRISGSGPTGFYKGVVDEIALYNRGLTASEVQAIFNAGSFGKACIPPEVLVQPANARVKPGTNVTFSAGFRGTAPLTYQWKLNGADISGATNSSLTISNVQPSKAGSYALAITNALGWTVSSNATLKVDVITVLGNGLAITNSQTNFSTQVTIQLQNVYSNGDIFYTLDGSEPSFFSTFYSGPFIVNHGVILRALGYSADFYEAGELDPITISIVPTYLLSASTPGGGTISLNPAGGTYLSNTIVNATATPASGWTFLQWVGDVISSNASTQVKVDRNKTIKAVFGTTFTATAAGGGNVLLDPPGGIYPYGTIVWLSAVPQQGNFFVLWGNAGSGSVNPLSFGITNANRSVSSLFSSVPSGQAALAVVPLGNGRVTVNPRTNIYNLGANVTITATADAGQRFLNWSGDASGTQNPLSVTLNQNKTIYANFSHQAVLSTRASYEGPKPEGFVLTLTGDAGAQYAIGVSTNLLNWTNLATVTNPWGTVQFLDTASTNFSRRFYRAVLQ
jgi:hypothetical protein